MEIEIVTIAESIKWDSIVNSFPDYDIYYLSGYVKAFELHGDGSPLLFYAHDNFNRAICVLMLRDIAKDFRFSGIIPKGEFYDMVTPYGYGGFIFDTTPSVDFLDHLKSAFFDALNKIRVISVFFRFHPVFKNADYHRKMIDVVDLGKTISIDLTSADVIWENIISKNRNMIRKAEKNGIVIKHAKSLDLLVNKFLPIYNATMAHDNAEEYYYFPQVFYESIDHDLNENYEVFFAEYDSKIIAASIMLFANGRLNYHLSGSLIDYRRLAPSNLLLYKAAIWGQENGCQTFHLGGGVGSGEDNLYKFKAAFNRNSDCRFSIGKLIVNHEKYDRLVAIRKLDPVYDTQTQFFPTYRG